MNSTLHFIEQGQGVPLILLHGNGENCNYFQHQMDAFSRHFRVIALDTRGHGASPRGGAPFTLEQFSLDLLHFMDEKGIEKAHLLGFSDGGNIALLFALQHPRRVGRLILNGANLCPGGVKKTVQLPIVAAYHLLRLVCIFDKKALPKRELLSLMVTQPHIEPAQLKALSMPVLVIAGTRDMIKRSHTRAIASACPQATLVLLKGNHFSAAKESKAFNAAVLSFLQEQSP